MPADRFDTSDLLPPGAQVPAPSSRAPWRRRVAAVAIGISGPVVGLLWWQEAILLAIGLHAAAAIVAWFFWRRPDEPDDMVAIQAATLVAAFPVVGAPIAFVIFGRETEVHEDLRNAYEDYIRFEHEAPRWDRPMTDANAELLREMSVRPLVDQLRHGDLASKHAAAEALRRQEGAEGVRCLRQALSHPADDTRLLASLALIKLEEELVRALGKARAEAAEQPRDAESQRALVAILGRYTSSGLPVGKAAEHLWREAEGAATRARAIEPGHLEDELAIARARQALADPAGALVAAERAAAAAPHDPVPALLRCELLYGLGRTAELRAAAATLGALATPGTDAHEIAAFWTGGSKMPTGAPA